MNMVIFGAASPIGRALVTLALDRGYTVTAVARDPGRVGVSHPHLVFARGDLLDGASLGAALRGQEAACSVIRIRRGGRGLLLAEGIANLLQAMRAGGVTRLVVLEPVEKAPGLFHRLLGDRAAVAEGRVIEGLLRASPIAWTLVQERRGASPARLAECLLVELEGGTHIRQVISDT